MDNMYRRYLQDMKNQIEKRNQYSDNKKEWIKVEKAQAIQRLYDENRISLNDIKEAKRIMK